MKALPPAMSKQGGGLAKFIGNPSAITKAMDLPASQQTVDISATDTTPKPVVAPKALPAANLIPDPVAAFGQDAEGNTIYDKAERIRQFKENKAKRAAGFVSPPKEAGDIPKVDKLEDAGIGEKDVKEKVKKDLEDNLEIDPKMKKAFMDALALPAKSAAVAMTDLLAKIPAPSKEASKILNRNISKISNSFKLGAASSEVANDEEDNDNKEGGKAPSLLSALIGKAINFVKGKSGGGESKGGEQPQLPGSSPQQNLLPGASGDPTFGRRAPYTGTADGIGLGDGSGRAMQPIKKRKSAAAKLFGMTPMGMAFNAGTKMFKGAKSFMKSNTFNNIKNIGGKALGMTPMGMMAKFMMKNTKIGGIFAKGEQKTNLTELTDKTIQENRESADAKTKKDIALAGGTGDAISSSMPSSPSSDPEGGALAQPNIKDSPYLDVYNVTSQF